MSANKLFIYELCWSDYTRRDTTRRLKVVSTVRKRSTEERHFVEHSDNEKNELIASSIATRFRYDMKPPITTKVLRMTLFRPSLRLLYL